MKTMKGMDIFCGSPASTAICSSIDQRSMVRRSHRSGTDQHHQQSPRNNLLDHHHHDHHRRIKNQNQHQQPRHHHVPCSSQLPINPRPAYHNYEKSRKSCSDNYNLVNNNNINKYTGEVRRKSSADVYDLKSRRTTSPTGSSRYLLSESTSNFIDCLSSETDRDRVQRVVSANDGDGHDQQAPKVKFRSLSTNDQGSSLRAGSSSTCSRHQVVVLKVSLHCKGCEGKVRKHLSKMEGVTSFSVDFEEKKVTVIGDITPLGVLASVSKVKNAQLWPSPTSSSPSFTLVSMSTYS